MVVVSSMVVCSVTILVISDDTVVDSVLTVTDWAVVVGFSKEVVCSAIVIVDSIVFTEVSRDTAVTSTVVAADSDVIDSDSVVDAVSTIVVETVDGLEMLSEIVDVSSATSVVTDIVVVSVDVSVSVTGLFVEPDVFSNIVVDNVVGAS